MFDNCGIVSNEKKNWEDLSWSNFSYKKNFNISNFFNEIANDQDFDKLTGGLDRVEFGSQYWNEN